ncbi:cold-shock protein [Marinagarivorans algicola]|uniref:cold-shock protein n=1 Tax=Marinagarivorans algicola TaxID=1513270 RepID=UPI0009E7E559|nr:cold shock domain-containing protein [Marinagarivorans algicola]
MPKGIVKWFNNAKGFGFIVSEDAPVDIFAHYSAINMDGFRTLKTGQQVEFELESGDKGWHALNIRIPNDTQHSMPATPVQPSNNAQNSIEQRLQSRLSTNEPAHYASTAKHQIHTETEPV